MKIRRKIFLFIVIQFLMKSALMFEKEGRIQLEFFSEHFCDWGRFKVPSFLLEIVSEL